MRFEELTNETELIDYLNSSNERLKNRKFIYHYTTINKCIQLFISKVWFLSNAKDMNDKLEYDNGDKDYWKNIFFASFMSDADESIGMWSMYSQPWHDGVQIAIPVEIAKRWVKDTTIIEEISCTSFKTTGKQLEVNNMNKVFLSAVAYTNCDNDVGEKQRLTWSTAKNTIINNPSHRAQLTGYIKDSAWEYEKEIRIKAFIDNKNNFQKVAIPIPKYVFDSMVITASPLFKGELQERMKENIKRVVNTDKSIFTNKLKISNICDNCTLQNSKGI